ncbi:MAG: enoyl-CoA hydratase/isomerase family protein [Myxococcaceae bacterium]
MVEITMAGPSKNALGTAMLDFLLGQLDEAAGRAVLLTGAGDAFSAGLDLKELASLDAKGLEAFLRKLEAVVEALYTYSGPTVALVNGHAIAGGCILALACDHQVAAANPKARIGLSEIALGLELPPVALSVVRERVPKRYLNRVLLGAELHDPGAALRLGLVDEVSDQAEQLARARLAALAAHPRPAYAHTKAALRGDTVDSVQNERRFQQMLPAWTSDEARRRIAAVLKR